MHSEITYLAVLIFMYTLPNCYETSCQYKKRFFRAHASKCIQLHSLQLLKYLHFKPVQQLALVYL